MISSIQKFVMHLLAVLGKVLVILLLTILFGYCILNMGPINWILWTDVGFHAHIWLLTSLGRQGGVEDALDSLIILSYSGMLPPSVWLYTLLTHQLRELKSKPHERTHQ